MSEFSFQNALVQVLVDPKMREAIYAGDPSPLADYGISPDEAQRISQIDRGRLEMFAEMIIDNRIYSAAQWMPFTAQLMGKRMVEIALEFNRDLSPEYSKRQDHAMAFATFLKSLFSVEPPTPPFLEDVLTYELMIMEMFVGYDKEEGQEPSIQVEELLQLSGVEEALESVVPCRRPNNRVISVNYDVPLILQEMSEGRTPTELPEQPMRMLLRLVPPGFVEQDKINAPTAAFINTCDGQTSLHKVIKSLAAYYQKDDPASFHSFRGKCLELCQSLVARQVIFLMALSTIT